MGIEPVGLWRAGRPLAWNASQNSKSFLSFQTSIAQDSLGLVPVDQDKGSVAFEWEAWVWDSEVRVPTLSSPLFPLTLRK